MTIFLSRRALVSLPVDDWVAGLGLIELEFGAGFARPTGGISSLNQMVRRTSGVGMVLRPG